MAGLQRLAIAHTLRKLSLFDPNDTNPHYTTDLVPVQGSIEANFYIKWDSYSGTTGIDISVQTYDPVTDLWFDLIAFSRITAASGSEKQTVASNLGWQLRLKMVGVSGDEQANIGVGAVVKS